jgi:hypothetical protein
VPPFGPIVSSDAKAPADDVFARLFGTHTPPAWSGVHARDRDLDPNSALIWLPPILRAGLPVPRTEVIRVDPDALWVAIGDARPEETTHAHPVPWDEMEAAAARIGYPCFVRTDLSSAKHDGPACYRLDGPDGLRGVVLSTFYDNATKDLASGPTPLRAMLFRAWLDLDAPFSAFGDERGQHPIAHEWRVFAGGGTPPCTHFYWPEGAIEDHAPSVEDWRTQRNAMEQIPALSLGQLVVLAESAVRAVNGGDAGPRWSVDFARDRAGLWWLIDMALASASWHPAHPPSPGASE